MLGALLDDRVAIFWGDAGKEKRTFAASLESVSVDDEADVEYAVDDEAVIGQVAA